MRFKRAGALLLTIAAILGAAQWYFSSNVPLSATSIAVSSSRPLPPHISHLNDSYSEEVVHTTPADTEQPRAQLTVVDDVPAPPPTLSDGASTSAEWPVYRNTANESIDESFRDVDGTQSISTLSPRSSTTIRLESKEALAEQIGPDIATDRKWTAASGDDEQVIQMDTWRGMMLRSLNASAQRLYALAAYGRGTASNAVQMLPWARCVDLVATRLLSPSSESWRLCKQEWDVEADACLAQHVLLRTLVDSSKLTMEVQQVLRKSYSSQDTAEELYHAHVLESTVTPRKLERVEVQPANVLIGEQLNATQWTSPFVVDVRVPMIPDHMVFKGEGVCLDATSKHYDITRNREMLLTALQLDAADTIEVFRRVPLPSVRRNSSASWCDTLVPSDGNHVLSFMRRSRWMFDRHVPFALASDGERSAPPRADVVGVDIPPSQAAETDVETLDAVFRIRANRVVLQKAGSYKMSQLLAPLYYNMSNVCLSPHGYGISGYVPNDRWPYPTIPAEMRDERRNKIRLMGMRRRITRPKHFIDKPLFLSPVMYQSNNFGHVMYRLGSQQMLLRNSLVPPVAPVNNPEDYILGFVVLPNAAGTFGVTSSMRHFYQLWNQTWLSVGRFRPIAEGRRPNPSEEQDELCFRTAVIGHDALYMYHSVGSSAPIRKRMLLSAQGSQRKLEGYFELLRQRMRRCFVDPVTTLLVSSSRTQSHPFAKLLMPSSKDNSNRQDVPIRLLVIQRTQRRVGNLNRLLSALVLHYGVPLGAGYELKDSLFSKGRRIEVVVADLLHMTTAEQAMLVGEADIVFAVHGTALQWMFMMRPGSVVVEIQFHGIGCISEGVHGLTSTVASRIFCEFGKTSLASQVTHIAHKTRNVFGDEKHRLNVLLPRTVFLSLIDTALCSLHAGYARSTASCTAHYPSSS